MTSPPNPDSPYAPYALGASPLELSESLAAAWRLHASLLAIARTAETSPSRTADEQVAETYRRALLPLDTQLAAHRHPPAPESAARARDRLTILIGQGKALRDGLLRRLDAF